jgi:hypothetical protein
VQLDRPFLYQDRAGFGEGRVKGPEQRRIGFNACDAGFCGSIFKMKITQCETPVADFFEGAEGDSLGFKAAANDIRPPPRRRQRNCREYSRQEKNSYQETTKARGAFGCGH